MFTAETNQMKGNLQRQNSPDHRGEQLETTDIREPNSGEDSWKKTTRKNRHRII